MRVALSAANKLRAEEEMLSIISRRSNTGTPELGNSGRNSLAEVNDSSIENIDTSVVELYIGSKSFPGLKMRVNIGIVEHGGFEVIEVMCARGDSLDEARNRLYLSIDALVSTFDVDAVAENIVTRRSQLGRKGEAVDVNALARVVHREMAVNVILNSIVILDNPDANGEQNFGIDLKLNSPVETKRSGSSGKGKGIPTVLVTRPEHLVPFSGDGAGSRPLMGMQSPSRSPAGEQASPQDGDPTHRQMKAFQSLLNSEKSGRNPLTGKISDK